jgi:3D (Asp-Asp-Asp) domain-containing protein
VKRFLLSLATAFICTAVVGVGVADTPVKGSVIKIAPVKVQQKYDARKSSPGISRGFTRKNSDMRVMQMRVTAYTLKECGKPPGHPAYGRTSSGKLARQWETVAAIPSLPFGTKVYIDAFKDKPNHGVFEVQDRGGSVNGIDVYMESVEAALKFGRPTLEVIILEEGRLDR